MNRIIYNPFKDLNIEQAKELIGGIADTDKLWFYGYRKKAIIYTVGDVFYRTVFMIRRLAKVDSNGHREYIYLYPSFALKRCPFSLDTIDQIYTDNMSKGADPLDNIDDPQNILECSDGLMVWIKRLATRVENAALLENLSSSYLRITQSMPDINKSVTGCIYAYMILIEQPYIRKNLDSSYALPLKQRISVFIETGALSSEETKGYVEHHISLAGGKQPIFHDKCYPVLYQLTGGIPRMINQICYQAMVRAYGIKSNIITDNMITSAFESLRYHLRD